MSKFELLSKIIIVRKEIVRNDLVPEEGARDCVSRVTVGLPFSASPGGRSCIMPKLGVARIHVSSSIELYCRLPWLFLELLWLLLPFGPNPLGGTLSLSVE